MRNCLVVDQEVIDTSVCSEDRSQDVQYSAEYLDEVDRRSDALGGLYKAKTTRTNTRFSRNLYASNDLVR